MKKSWVVMLLLLLSCGFAMPAGAATPRTDAPLVKDGIRFYPKNKLSGVQTYTVYYGEDKIEEMKRFDLAILETASQTEERIRDLTKSGTIALGYISIGEADPETWYYPFVDKKWMLGDNTNWNSQFIDVRHQGWHDLVLNKMIPRIAGYGVQGLFLDTVDTVDVEPGMKDAMTDLIREIREAYPDLILVMNRGLTIMDEAIPYIDGLMFESFSGNVDWDTVDWDTNPPRAVYRQWTGGDELWTTDVASKLGEWQRRTGLTVLALDYSNPGDKESIEYAYERATAFGTGLWDFVPYVSTLDLQHIYKHNIDYQRSDAFRDSDGDGVTDAEEIEAGLNPAKPFSKKKGLSDLSVFEALKVKQWAEERLKTAADEKAKAALSQVAAWMDSFMQKPDLENIMFARMFLLQYQATAEPDPGVTETMSRLNDLTWQLKSK
ncbi:MULTISPECIES: endo alpha-1,4 polygalactosaminidase [unclassified Paenibacillus]|uniref:endo alpha-1,4 polygalactosaminidase n=1 Tax=unclassified Paenibacillus TaxID=185978 RepID=UPI001C0FE3CB|nr:MULTISPECIES: endo alpha-1,4 polygalactosaminidase [unclassified Paenibacillus]MBU5440902.1 endo alpha-1,4 polygalactosaminidase [Paenibacillus sp. MSJ-34]CAH0118396.1 hypothetical protein PAE9249_00883 [Paenibacillus sp. CECT 9249]